MFVYHKTESEIATLIIDGCFRPDEHHDTLNIEIYGHDTATIKQAVTDAKLAINEASERVHEMWDQIEHKADRKRLFDEQISLGQHLRDAEASAEARMNQTWEDFGSRQVTTQEELEELLAGVDKPGQGEDDTLDYATLSGEST